MTSVYTTDWAFIVVHIWSNLQVHTVPGTGPRKGVSVAKAAQLLTQMVHPSLMIGILISTTIRKKASFSQNRV